MATHQIPEDTGLKTHTEHSSRHPLVNTEMIGNIRRIMGEEGWLTDSMPGSIYLGLVNI